MSPDSTLGNKGEMRVGGIRSYTIGGGKKFASMSSGRKKIRDESTPPVEGMEGFALLGSRADGGWVASAQHRDPWQGPFGVGASNISEWCCKCWRNFDWNLAFWWFFTTVV